MALALLTMFYLAAIPTGRLDVRAEGTYLLVNKTLIEAGAVAVLFACRTGSMAGFDRLWRRCADRKGEHEGGGRMNLTPEQMDRGRRNFLRVLAGTPAMAALGVAAGLRGPIPGGRVRVGFVGVGAQGRAQLGNVDPDYEEVRALCDINPAQLALADAVLAKNSMPPARHYSDWREMLQKEDVEAVIMAPPLWAHADLAVGCLEAGKHVLCEKMMAWDIEGCERMRAAAERNDRVLEIGYQRNYNPMYQAAYDGIIKTGAIGDIYHVRLAWHRNGTWRRKGEPPAPDYDPSKWGYPTFDHLYNWRLYWKYSAGPDGGAVQPSGERRQLVPGVACRRPVIASGGLYRFPDHREVYDHVYATFEYPGGRTAVFSSIESNAFDDYYETYLRDEGHADPAARA